MRCVLLLGFVWLAARFWHPHYGFTALLQFDESASQVMLPALRDEPIFLHPGENGYDGLYYAQLAAAPALDDPGLRQALDSPSSRGRRILLSWIGWALGAGDPGRAVQVYAGLNIALWFGLAAVLWRIFPPGNWRTTAAWGGLLLSAGVLHNVRLSLTDLLALLLLVLAWRRVEAGRLLAAGIWLGLAGLARETALLGVVMLLPSARRDLGRAVPALAAALGPLAVWMIHIRLQFGPTEPGLGNFTWPLLGWLKKWAEIARLPEETNYFWLAVTTALAHVTLTAQAVYLVRQRSPGDAAWRLGAGFVLLLAALGPAVWEGHPGAATRVLLPLAFAFNVLAMRRRANWGWLVAGNLGLFAGVLALWQAPRDPREVAAGRAGAFTYVVRTSDAFHQGEHRGRKTWAWCPGDGTLAAEIRPQAQAEVRPRLALRAFEPGRVQVRHAGSVIWEGLLTKQVRWIDLPSLPVADGRLVLQLSSLAPGRPEHDGPGARTLAFAVYGVELR